jgi:hypothetical protein
MDSQRPIHAGLKTAENLWHGRVLEKGDSTQIPECPVVTAQSPQVPAQGGAEWIARLRRQLFEYQMPGVLDCVLRKAHGLGKDLQPFESLSFGLEGPADSRVEMKSVAHMQYP